jgi:hypothetical protein
MFFGLLFIGFGTFNALSHIGDGWRVFGEIGSIMFGLFFLRYSIKGYVFYKGDFWSSSLTGKGK